MTKLFLVIHYLNLNTCLKNAAIAAENKCEGVFLINMEGAHTKLNGPAVMVQEKFPELKVGINRLEISPVDAIEENENIGINLTWSDTCGIHSFYPNHPLKKEIKAKLKEYTKHKFFGSVAFKGQKTDPQPAHAAKEAHAHGFIPVTSGTATGSPPNVRKIQRMAEVLPKNKLGVASGITPENASEFLPHCGFILVSTGISKDFHNFDPYKVQQLSKAK